MKQESKEYYGDLAKFYDWRMAGDVEDIPFYVELAKEAGGPVLELGCGTGRVTLPIAESGTEVVGLDLSQDMLTIAGQKLSRMSRDGSTTDTLAAPAAGTYFPGNWTYCWVSLVSR